MIANRPAEIDVSRRVHGDRSPRRPALAVPSATSGREKQWRTEPDLPASRHRLRQRGGGPGRSCGLGGDRRRGVSLLDGDGRSGRCDLLPHEPEPVDRNAAFERLSCRDLLGAAEVGETPLGHGTNASRQSSVSRRRACSPCSRTRTARASSGRSPRIVSRMLSMASGAEIAISRASAWAADRTSARETSRSIRPSSIASSPLTRRPV